MSAQAISFEAKPISTHQCFFYELAITSILPCSYFTIGKVKHEINLERLITRDDCFHNDAAYVQKLIQDGWANNFTSPRSSEIFDCHFIKYVEVCDGIEFNIKILFFSLKAGEYLIPSVIKADNQIITIIRNHIMISNNITSSIYHNYRIELLCQEIANCEILDLRYQGHSTCKTALYTYQRDSIQWAINLEANLPLIEFSEHKLLYLDEIGLVFDYNLCGGDKCFIRRSDIPQMRAYGGIIADEVGLGKTVQALSLTLSIPCIKTLIIVPNHMKDHWLAEMKKHFIDNPFEELVMIATVAEVNQFSNEFFTGFQRLIVDELAELYAKCRPENYKLFARLCGLDNFHYRWGITATPFVDDTAMYNIIQFLLGNNKIYNTAIGNYTYIQDQFKTLFRKNIKANVQMDIKLPNVVINDRGLIFSEHERAILAAMEMDSTTFNINDRLRVISNVMLEFTNNDKSVITVEELKQLTVQRFQEKIDHAKIDLQNLQDKFHNIQEQIKELMYEESSADQHHGSVDQHHGSVSGASPCNTGGQQKFCDIMKDLYKKDYYAILSEYQERKRHFENEIEASRRILERREQVHRSYLEMTHNIDAIIQSTKSSSDEHSSNADDNMEEMDIMTMINEDKMCPICYCPFSENIVLFIKCRHYFCQGCFEHCHKLRPNTCPMCRTHAEKGEINYIGLNKQVITSTKNTEILRILNSHPDERFLIFTRFDKFIEPLTTFLATNDISARTFNNFREVPQEARDATRVILLSANSNASGTDMTFMNRVIIIEPFDNYIYGKEIEKQLIGRLHRINQIHDVNVYRLFIKHTIEEEIYSLG